jgi:hypothetical protein
MRHAHLRTGAEYNKHSMKLQPPALVALLARGERTVERQERERR